MTQRLSKLFSFSKPNDTQDGAGSSGLTQQVQGDGKIDLVFLQDTTASQEPYIKSAKSAIKSICTLVGSSTSSKGGIRFGLIAFRDHPPEDDTYVTKNFGFTSSITMMKWNLSRLDADGGGDGPEASTAALAEALDGMKWKEGAAKLVVLITDAPPHGIGEFGDNFPEGSPDQNDPLVIARQMAERGITLFVIACEPGLSRYSNAVDFYTALADITGGRMFPLTQANDLAAYISGTTIETIETERLINQYSAQIVESVYGQSTPMETVMEQVHEELKKQGAKTKTLEVENIYRPSSQTQSNIDLWKRSEKVCDGKGGVASYSESRVRNEYLSGTTSPSYGVVEAEVKYAQAQRIVMQSVMRSSVVTPSGMVKRT